MGIEPYLLTSGLKAILNQRLVRRRCERTGWPNKKEGESEHRRTPAGPNGLAFHKMDWCRTHWTAAQKQCRLGGQYEYGSPDPGRSGDT